MKMKASMMIIIALFAVSCNPSTTNSLPEKATLKYEIAGINNESRNAVWYTDGLGNEIREDVPKAWSKEFIIDKTGRCYTIKRYSANKVGLTVNIYLNNQLIASNSCPDGVYCPNEYLTASFCY
jgi:hypothetical protein